MSTHFNRLTNSLLDKFGYILFFTTALALVSTWFWANGFEAIFNAFAFPALILLYPLSLYAIYHKVRTFDQYAISASKLLILYIELILTFTIAYLWYTLLCDNQAFYGIYDNEIFSVSKSNFDYYIYLKNLFKLFIDLFHFSIVTSTTLGYGDAYPITTLSKIIVDFQVLFSLGITVLGFGKYFSQLQKL